MIGTDTIAYIAGLIDGEGSIYFKKTKQIRHKRKGKPIHNITVIRIEVAMTDRYIVEYIKDVFKVGTVGERKVKPGRKRQWRWRCCHRDALYVAKLIWPYTQVKLHQIEKIIDHYDVAVPDRKNVIDLETYRITHARPQR